MKPLRILVADDHAVVRRGVCTLLEHQVGWEIVGEAENGEEAIRKTRELKPDVIVLDITMPILNGLEAGRQILKEAPRAELVFLTMHQSEEVAREVLRAGARAYVLKADADAELVCAIRAVSRHRPYLSPSATEMALKKYRQGNGEAIMPSRQRLTPRERQVVQLVAEGKTNREIADRFGISTRTVETHRNNIMRKLELDSVSGLVRYAIRNNLVQP